MVEITNNYSNYISNNNHNDYGNYAASHTNTTKAAECAKSGRKANGAEGTKPGRNAKTSGVTTSTVELKTSTPKVTRTEQIKTGFENVNDYSKYLQGKYGYMNTGTTSMQGIPTTVSVSGAFLKKCMDDPEKAKYLEGNLAAIPDCVKSLANFTKMMPGSPVCTYAAYIIGDDGNITCMSGCTNDPDGKIARENAERKAKEGREKEEKLKEKRAKERAEQRKAEEEQAVERAAEKAETYTMTVTGTSVKGITERFADFAGRAATEGMSAASAYHKYYKSVDIKA